MTKLDRLLILKTECYCCGNKETKYIHLYAGFDSLYMHFFTVRLLEYYRYENSLRGIWDQLKYDVRDAFGLE